MPYTYIFVCRYRTPIHHLSFGVRDAPGSVTPSAPTCFPCLSSFLSFTSSVIPPHVHHLHQPFDSLLFHPLLSLHHAYPRRPSLPPRTRTLPPRDPTGIPPLIFVLA